MKLKIYSSGLLLCLLTTAMVYLPFTKSTLHREPRFPADRYFREGMTAFSAGLLSQSEKAFKLSLKYQPHYAPSHYYLAEIYTLQGLRKAAKAELIQVMKLDPECAFACYKLGQIFRKEGEYEKAVFLFKKTIALSPGYREAYWDLAQLYLEQGDFVNAERIYQELEALEGKD